MALLQDAVDHGASVGFLAPLDNGPAWDYWLGVMDRLESGLICWVALDGQTIVGTVQLDPCTKQNGRHRGEVCKLLTLSSYRRRGVAALLMQRDATVTVCHSRTKNLAEVVREAEIVIAAIGRPLMIRGDMIREGAAVIDVGMNRLEPNDPVAATLRDPEKLRTMEQKGSVLVGDVDFHSARERAGWITPVPGGVGPMTIAMLMHNTVVAARNRRR